MIVCIGNGGHARALELPADTIYICASPGDIRKGRVELPAGNIVIGVGHPKLESASVRREISHALFEAGVKHFPCVHVPTHIVGSGIPDRYSPRFYLGPGAHVFRNVHIGPGANIGNHCILNTGCIIEHDVTIGDYTHIAPGAIVLGEAHIGSGCLIGAGAIVLPGAVVPDNTLVKAGERYPR